MNSQQQLPEDGAPVEPVEPVEVTEPGEPTRPVEPGEPTRPRDAARPVEPVEPSEPAEPGEPAPPTQPIEPTTATQPIEAGHVAAGVSRLATAECWALLESAEFGRLAVTDAKGAPDIFPVNFIAFEGALYLRTAHGSKLSRIVAHPAAALEIDGEDAGTRWSVVVRGSAQRVHEDAELRASGAGRIVTWSPGSKPFTVKITPQSVSGRRFAQALPRPAGEPGHPVTASIPRPVMPPLDPSSATAAAEPAAPEPDADRTRSHRPDPIPHHPPVQDGHP